MKETTGEKETKGGANNVIEREMRRGEDRSGFTSLLRITLLKKGGKK